MKKILLLPLLIVSCFCLGQDAKEIIGRPVKIGNLLVAQNDFPEVMDCVDAIKACRSLGKGWRLPNKTELNILYTNSKKIGGFKGNNYWSSTFYGAYSAWAQNFSDGSQPYNHKNYYSFYVRAVKSLK
jgi:hypothetical protein